MDPPPAPPQAPPLTTTTTTTTTTPTTTYPDSLDSSPRSRNTDSWGDDPPLPPPSSQTSSKLRLMCSYGGHIVPRPHDKSLCYVGGDTRMVVVDRHSSLNSLSSKLSHTLLNGRPFTLKYQLPNEDLDSLISVTTDEDLDNMIDEYDRNSTNSNSNSNNNNNNSIHKPSRLRLFLFPLKPDSSQSIGPLLDNSVKSEDWFLNALNGAGLNHGFSDSSSVNCLLGLDDDDAIVNTNNNSKGNSNNNSNLDLVAREAEVGSQKNNMKMLQGQDVQSVPDSPMLETSSSFGSTSSSPSLANLPPIRLHVEESSGGRVQQDQKAMMGVVGIEEQFAQMSVVGVGQMQKQQPQPQQQQQQDEGGFVVLSSPVNVPVSGVPVNSGVVTGDYMNRVFSDDERSDHGVPVGVGYRKPPPPQSQPQTLTQQRSSAGSGGGNIDLASPDSVSSDSSLSNPLSRQKPVIYQDPSVVQVTSGVNRVPANNPVDSKVNMSDPNTRVQIVQQMQDSAYVLQHQPQPQFDQQQQQQQLQQQQQQQLQQQQLQQQQYIHAGAHYIYHHPTGTVPNSAYYPVYPSQQQQQQHHYHQLDQQQQVYYVQARQPQAYNLPVQQQQSSISETATAIPSNRPQTPPNPAMVHNPAAAYNPMRNAPIAKPEMAASGVYRTANTGSPQLVQVPTSQHQQQFVGYSQIHHPSQSVAPTSAATANYGYEFADPAHAQIYYTQPLAPTMPSQYQTMTAAAAFQESSAQSDNIMQHIRTSQPL